MIRVQHRGSRLLTVRKTDASSRMTEYTSPLLLMKTCMMKKRSRSRHPATRTRGVKVGDVPRNRGPPGGYAKPRGSPDPAGCQRCCSLWSWTQPCLPCLMRGERRGTKDHRGRTEAINGDGGWLPCRATIRLAMQSGTLVPAARKVMPMM